LTEQRAADNINTSNPVVEALDDWGYENTLASRDPSADRLRHADANAAVNVSRSDTVGGVSTRESQRGRRRAGETVPPHSLGDDPNMPAVQLTRTSTSTRPDNHSFDVERQAGIPPPAGSPYNTWSAYNAQAPSPVPSDAGVPHPQGAHPQGVYGSPPTSAPTHLAVQQPGAQPQGSSPGRPLVGARHRGSSVSQPQGGPAQGQPGPSGPAGRI
jgi:hypothetical protein